jgi:hypothetical protein
MARCLLFTLLTASLLASSCAFQFMPSGKKEILKTEGGCVAKWDPHGPLECAGAGAGMLELEPGGLVLPKYSNEPHLAYVVEGNGEVKGRNKSGGGFLNGAERSFSIGETCAI